MPKRFILNADDFGMSKAANRAIAEAYGYGFLKSASITANGETFDEAINVILPKCPDLGLGIHLNITEGSPICTDVDLLTNADRKFCNSFIKILIKSFNPKEKDFLEQIEREFRRQIETVLSKAKIYHIDSHDDIHAIPPIFDIVCRLAKEYNIPQVRTHFEKFYLVPEFYRHFNKQFYLNLLEKFLLNFFTIFNENTVNKYGLKTNDYIIGTQYSASMDALAIAYGLNTVKYNNITVEALIHPRRYDEGTIDNYFDEYMIARNKKLAEKILRLGYDITNYVVKEDEPETTTETES